MAGLRLIILITLFFVAGCGNKNKLNRSSLDNWEVKNFTPLKMSVELPQDILKKKKYEVYEFSDNNVLYAFIHTYDVGIQDGIDIMPLAVISLTKEQYSAYLNKKCYDLPKCFDKTTFFPEITEYDTKHPDGRTPLRCFRKDYKNEKTGDVILSAVSYMDNLECNVQFRDKDIEAIKRMLISIKFIDDDGKAVSKPEAKSEKPAPLPAPDDKAK